MSEMHVEPISEEAPDVADTLAVFANRIVRYDAAVDPRTLKPHPLNPKIHPDAQKAALKGALGEIGWIDTIKVNVRTGLMIDGHERREQALAAGETVPVTYVDLSEEEERLAITTLDPIGQMANYSPEALNALLSDIQTASEPIAQLLADIQVDSTPTFQNKGQTGDRQIERASIVRIAIQVEDVRTVERAINATGVEDRGNALLAICRDYLMRREEAADGE